MIRFKRSRPSSPNSVPVRVAKGAALLDEHEPGWESRVNPNTLDIQSGTDCVLGQVYGTWFEGVAVLPITGYSGGFGFNAEDKDVLETHREWAAQIVRRKVKVNA